MCGAQNNRRPRGVIAIRGQVYRLIMHLLIQHNIIDNRKIYLILLLMVEVIDNEQERGTQMSATVVVGLQFGDEGKGHISDYLAGEAGLVVRFNGGGNAGHTVVVGDETYKLHLVPCGTLHPGVKCLIGGGTAVDPRQLLEELEELHRLGVDTSQLMLDGNANVIMPYHRELERYEEEQRGKSKAIGTTKRGIGPCYAARTARNGMLMSHFCNEVGRADRISTAHSLLPLGMGTHMPLERLLDDARRQAGELLRAVQVVDGRQVIWEALDNGEEVLFEGAQGTFLDIDQGTFPFVTSSHPIAGGACLSGIGPRDIDKVIGVAKAYTTRVGNGPFPSRMGNELEAYMREFCGEYGATTGRPRDCGWLDMPMLRTAVRINGITGLALTKLDGLDGFETVQVVTNYELDDKQIDYVPSDTSLLSRCKPVCVEFPGWQSTRGACRWDDLPHSAHEYVEFIMAELPGCVSLDMVSVGPERNDIIDLR